MMEFSPQEKKVLIDAIAVRKRDLVHLMSYNKCASLEAIGRGTRAKADHNTLMDIEEQLENSRA